MSCPKCIAQEALTRLRALNAGQDVPELGIRLDGKPLNHSTQAGFAEVWLEQVTQAEGPLCARHRPARKARR